jgi:hypothetical protein
VFSFTFGNKVPYPQISFCRQWNFGQCQTARQVALADQKRLSGVNSLFYNKNIRVQPASFLLFLILLPYVSLAKASNFDISKYCSKKHNGAFLQNTLAKYAKQTAG